MQVILATPLGLGTETYIMRFSVAILLVPNTRQHHYRANGGICPGICAPSDGNVLFSCESLAWIFSKLMD